MMLKFLNADSVARKMEDRMYRLVCVIVNYSVGYPYYDEMGYFNLGLAIDEGSLPEDSPTCAHMMQEDIIKACDVLAEYVVFMSHRCKQWLLFEKKMQYLWYFVDHINWANFMEDAE